MENLEVLLAMQDDEFQSILQNDPVIEMLENEKFDFSDEYFELMQVFSGKSMLNDLILKPLTLGLWCFLYAIKNAYVCGGEIKNTDTDIFLYLLHNGFTKITENLFEDAADFCQKNNISQDEAKLFLLEFISLNFRPLELLPSGTSDGKAHFNLEWLISIQSIVHQLSGCDRFYILYSMPLIEAFYYLVQHLKQNDTKNQIKRRNKI
jgi:hypothetical protein